MGLKQFIETSGWHLAQLCRSPIKGQKGNQEYLIHGRQQSARGRCRVKPSFGKQWAYDFKWRRYSQGVGGGANDG